MKIKSIIVALGLIITMISGVGLNNSNKQINEVENQNTVAVEENVVKEENIISEIAQEEIKQEPIENNEVEEKKEDNQEVKTETTIETPQTTKTDTKKGTVTPNVQETTPKQEKANTSVIETPKKEETAPQVPKTLTPDDLEYWCVAGGSHHVAGDGANEHGYYSSWNEANQAFESYTKGWNSVQYKIDTCPCGKYYFWAIQ